VSKRILLIDSDERFARGLSSAMKARGFTATLATDSERGMSIAKEENPDLIVVCVEAQPTNGYMLCTRLKKDDQLKAIPVILTSSTATPDSFEKHKKLKTRAEEYLIKPFAPRAMLEKASRLLGLTLPPEPGGEAGIVSVQDEPLGLGDVMDGEDEPISLSAADAAEARSALTEEPLLVEEIEEVVEVQAEGAREDELEMFDKAFDSLEAVGGQAISSATTRFADQVSKEPTELSAPDDDPFLESLAEDEKPVARSSPRSPGDGQQELARLKKELSAKAKELAQLQKQQTALEAQAQQLKEDAAKREAAAKALQQRADALAVAAKKFERELSEAKKGGGDDKDALAAERDELKRQLEEAQISAGENENRVVKAYAKLKSDDKLREKARRALTIALQLLEDNAPDDDEADEKKVGAKA
jgi:DNA-binding response OmpR family regulator